MAFRKVSSPLTETSTIRIAVLQRCGTMPREIGAPGQTRHIVLGYEQ